MTPEQITKASQDLFQAEKKREQIKLLTSDYPDMKMDEAYAVQKALVGLKIADGCKVTGWKIGLTSKACLLYTSPSPRDATLSRMPSSA